MAKPVDIDNILEYLDADVVADDAPDASSMEVVTANLLAATRPFFTRLTTYAHNQNIFTMAADVGENEHGTPVNGDLRMFRPAGMNADDDDIVFLAALMQSEEADRAAAAIAAAGGGNQPQADNNAAAAADVDAAGLNASAASSGVARAAVSARTNRNQGAQSAAGSASGAGAAAAPAAGAGNAAAQRRVPFKLDAMIGDCTIWKANIKVAGDAPTVDKLPQRGASVALVTGIERALSLHALILKGERQPAAVIAVAAASLAAAAASGAGAAKRKGRKASTHRSKRVRRTVASGEANAMAGAGAGEAEEEEGEGDEEEEEEEDGEDAVSITGAANARDGDDAGEEPMILPFRLGAAIQRIVDRNESLFVSNSAALSCLPGIFDRAKNIMRRCVLAAKMSQGAAIGDEISFDDPIVPGVLPISSFLPGFGINGLQYYVKIGLCITRLHDEIANSRAINYMTRRSRGVALWIGVNFNKLSVRMSKTRIAELMDLNSPSELLRRLRPGEVTYRLQTPGTAVMSPCGTGAAHFVITLGVFVEQLAINASTSPRAIERGIQFWAHMPTTNDNSFLATFTVFPLLWMQRNRIQLGLDDDLQRMRVMAEAANHIHHMPVRYRSYSAASPTRIFCDACMKEIMYASLGGKCIGCFVDAVGYDKASAPDTRLK